MAFSCARLGNKQLFNTVARIPSVLNSVSYAQSASAAPKLVFKKFEKPEAEHHDIKNARLNRPMSPHLTIYAIQFTSTTSITHRATGMLLSGYMTALGVGALVLPHDISHYITMIESMNISPAVLFLAKACISAPFGYHLANGLRHLYWDTGKGLSLNEVYSTGYAMLAISAIITVGLAAL